MAIDWNKPVGENLSRKSTDAYPTKTVMNLAQKAGGQMPMSQFVPRLIIVVLVVILFMKFGIFDFYAQLNAKQAELGTYTSQIAVAETQLMNYNAVEDEYNSYRDSNVLKAQANSANALSVLDLIDNSIIQNASVSSIKYEEATQVISVTISDISLENVGNLVSSLSSNELIASVYPSIASSDSDTVVANLNIELKTADGTDAAASSKGGAA